MPGSSSKPKRRASSTSLRAPSRAPSGAKTELHDSANAASSVPPQASPLAFCNATPSSVASVWIGKLSDGRAMPKRRTPASVTILNVEPGGWAAE